MFSSLFVCLLARLRRNYAADFHKIRWKRGMWDTEKPLDFDGNPDLDYHQNVMVSSDFAAAWDDGGGSIDDCNSLRRVKLQSNHNHQQTNAHFKQAGCSSYRPANSVRGLEVYVSGLQRQQKSSVLTVLICSLWLNKTNKKLSWRWQTRVTRLKVSQGHQTYNSIC